MTIIELHQLPDEGKFTGNIKKETHSTLELIPVWSMLMKNGLKVIEKRNTNHLNFAESGPRTVDNEAPLSSVALSAFVITVFLVERQ